MNIADLHADVSSRNLQSYLHGDLSISVILFDGDPGSGSKLHRHPYAEVFIMVEGRATVTVGDDTVEAAPSQILIAQPNQAHKFVNTGGGPLRSNSVHNGPRFIQEVLER